PPANESPYRPTTSPPQPCFRLTTHLKCSSPLPPFPFHQPSQTHLPPSLFAPNAARAHDVRPPVPLHQTLPPSRHPRPPHPRLLRLLAADGPLRREERDAAVSGEQGHTLCELQGGVREE
ncbi:hypothetical protein BU26DRAFT_550297, partial [Trematosphaeria pertusa]